MWFEVINDEKFNYFSVMNTGNYGYNGTERLIKKVDSMHNYYFIVDMSSYNSMKYNINYRAIQFDYKVADYIMNNFKEIEDLGMYKVYYHE